MNGNMLGTHLGMQVAVMSSLSSQFSTHTGPGTAGVAEQSFGVQSANLLCTDNKGPMVLSGWHVSMKLQDTLGFDGCSAGIEGSRETHHEGQIETVNPNGFAVTQAVPPETRNVSGLLFPGAACSIALDLGTSGLGVSRRTSTQQHQAR